jgi:hypothetical protein
MAYVKKRYRWGLSVIAILHHFSTPEIRALLKHCRKLIRDYCNVALEGEGYGASIIPFEMFDYGWVFAYDHDGEEWVLDVVTFPDWGAPHCRRRRPREEGAVQRAIENLKALGRPQIEWWIEDVKSLLYETRALGPLFTEFWDDISTGGSLHTVMQMFQKVRIPHRSKQGDEKTLPLLNEMAEQPSSYHIHPVQLVHAKVNDALGFLRPVWTFGAHRHARATGEGLWDASLFGALPEQGSG